MRWTVEASKVVRFGPKIQVKIDASDAAGQYIEEIQKAF